MVKDAVLGEIIRVGRAGVQKCDRAAVDIEIAQDTGLNLLRSTPSKDGVPHGEAPLTLFFYQVGTAQLRRGGW